MTSAYDKWRLSVPDDDRHEVGTEAGETCLRYDEPNEDAPRGYKPKPCSGVMCFDWGDATAYCDTCGELA
ncbi:hypothetical protein AN189_17460 [Loktanella sp. 3ANDIMAR09]|uniref:hypothetical protein n=1 Tax=Loktanella sp. 3ANDIMAR09 TaxID=1225657 RepID=UPI0006F85A01|nr:hypothetical protein [Loktanella sp. 3ANDIMAR09]KQI67013.1 hypothetical protein AN189_17460 [Loktanella sp. 3ANDIMAR09]